jgi:hypothetical protein
MAYYKYKLKSNGEKQLHFFKRFGMENASDSDFV